MSVLMSRTRHHKSATNASSRSSPAAPERDMSCITCLNLKRPLFQDQTLVLAEQAECQQWAGAIWFRNGLLREPAGQGLALKAWHSRLGAGKDVARGGRNGAQGRDRTTDTAIFSRMLYQLSYLGVLQRGAKAHRAGGL